MHLSCKPVSGTGVEPERIKSKGLSNISHSTIYKHDIRNARSQVQHYGKQQPHKVKVIPLWHCNE